ncbi:hypothetical protein phytr_920 [Candidatus Phycorickettsia trachydisci]|uniref:Uncharacterized protein n=1 Tax=Candidatus Phycorickettsia trachydisci TaxID=2115978 RepID=A0A2P1P705_9RICK|nr:hypothetical protein [Candidatus Phycorickettsia trachydisci]AVP87053.1 hypothetical protein phytr_920 [Candidatus Phycorickettsia trachydisci]
MAYQNTINNKPSKEDGLLLDNMDGVMDSEPHINTFDIKQLKKKISDKFLELVNSLDALAKTNLHANLEKLRYQEFRKMNDEMKILQKYYCEEKFKISGQRVSDKERPTYAMKRLYAWSEDGLRSSWINLDIGDIKDAEVKEKLKSLQDELHIRMISKQRDISKKFINLASRYIEDNDKDHRFRLEECSKYMEQCISKIDLYNISDLKKIETETNILLENFANLVGVDIVHKIEF